MLDPVEFGKHMAAIVKEAVDPLVRRIEELESMPKPKDGKDADPVEIDLEDITKAVLQAPEAIEAAVIKHLQANPPAPGKDGVGLAGASIDRDGNLILTMTNGEKKELGRVVGKDGVGLAGASISRDGELVVTLSSGEQKSLGPVVGRDGKDGADFSEFEFDYDGERTITIKGRGGEITKRVPVPLDRGYWREGMACEKGDVVTESGTAWIALRETKGKPALENKEDWRIFARKGRDGKDGKNGIDKTAPAKVKADA